MRRRRHETEEEEIEEEERRLEEERGGDAEFFVLSKPMKSCQSVHVTFKSFRPTVRAATSLLFMQEVHT